MTTKKTEAKPEDEKMVTFVPAESFTGWPFGYSKETRRGVEFIGNVESIPVPQSFADLMKTKGLVAEKQSTPPAVDA